MENKYKNDNQMLMDRKDPPKKDFVAQNNQDDDESGGGHGKSQKGFFKQEKLLKLIDKGRFNAQHFWRFLNKEGSDQHSIKETALEKFADEKLEKQETEEQTKSADEQLEKIQDLQMTDPEVDVIEEQTAAENGENDQEQQLQQKDQQEKTTQNQQQSDVEEMTRKAIRGDKLAGSIIGAHHGNPLGFTNATAQAGVTQQTQISNDNALQGKSAQFGALFANPHGLTVTNVQAGAIGSALTDNVKAQQEKLQQNEKNNSTPSMKGKR